MLPTHANEHDALLLRAARVVLPTEVRADASLHVAAGRIVQLAPADSSPPPAVRQIVELNDLTLMPGFVDLHIHGALGVDTMTATAADLHRVARFLATQGVTAWLPTLVPAPRADYQHAVAAIDELLHTQDALPPAARALGLHYEGPFVNDAMCGALRPAHFRTFQTEADVATLPTLAHAAVHMMTVAPEIAGGLALVRALCARAWLVALGHTRADLDVLSAAAQAGAHHMTHFFNAMAPLQQRAPGPIGWGLLRDDVTCDLIADGVHSDPLMLQLALRCKTPARLLLISDAVAPTGLGDGVYTLWGEQVTVAAGRTRNERGSIAGSVSTMRDGVALLARLGVALPDLAAMTAHNPARLLGLAAARGSLAVGQRADLVALDDAGQVRLTLVGGRVAYSTLPGVMAEA